MTSSHRAAGGAGERVAREPLTGRVSRERSRVVGSGLVGKRATPTQGAGAPDREARQDPQRNPGQDDRVNSA